MAGVRSRRSFFACIALLLGGCALQAPPAVPPHAGVAVPPAWSEPVPPAGAGLARWWRVFGDALLERLVEEAIAANTDVGVARANLMQARAARAEAAAALWPQVTGSVSAQRAAPSGASATNAFEAGFDASWEIDLFGGTRHGVAAQDALAQAAAATLGATRVSVAAEVARSYLQLRGAQARIAVARENLASQQETLQISDWRRQAGLANDVEVEQARTAVEQTRAQIPVLQSGAAQLAHALGVLTGRPPQALLQELATTAPLPQPRENLATAVPAQALAQRADVVAAESQLRAAAEAVAQADAARYPALDLSASLAWSGLTLGTVGSVSAARSVFAGLVQPLFDAGQRQARLAGRTAQYLAALDTLRGSVLAALRDVEDALSALDADRARLAALQAALASARNAALLATQRHASGLIDFQVVLETQRTLLNVQDSVTAAQADVATDHVRLYKALGGGWQPDRPEQLS
jgi:NodT family efflux transporter outer membrane factor (OMF) lipoprotein